VKGVVENSVGLARKCLHHIRADKAGTTGDQDFHGITRASLKTEFVPARCIDLLTNHLINARADETTVAAPLCRGAGTAEHGDRAPLLHMDRYL
jgi:hypothetical protein